MVEKLGESGTMMFHFLSLQVNNLLLDWNREVIEQCGFIDLNQELWYIPNIHEYPRMNFLMDTEVTTKILENIYERDNQSVLGIFHTHPNGVPWPSPRDIVGWPNTRLGWRYFIVTGSEVVEWELVWLDRCLMTMLITLKKLEKYG